MGAATTAAGGKKDLETVRLAEQPTVKVAQDTTAIEPSRTTLPAVSSESAVVKMPEARQPEAEKRGFFQRLNPLNWFRGGTKPRPTPLPSKTVSAPSALPAAAAPAG